MARHRKPEQEKDITIRIAGSRAERLQELAEQRGVLPQELVERAIDLMAKVLSSEVIEQTPKATAEAGEGGLVEEPPSLLMALAQMADAIPEEELGPLREDASEQHDHYIYGVPKRPR